MDMEDKSHKEKVLSAKVPVGAWVSFQEEAKDKGLTVSELLRRDYFKVDGRKGRGKKLSNKSKQNDILSRKVDNVDEVPDRGIRVDGNSVDVYNQLIDIANKFSKQKYTHKVDEKASTVDEQKSEVKSEGFSFGLPWWLFPIGLLIWILKQR